MHTIVPPSYLKLRSFLGALLLVSLTEQDASAEVLYEQEIRAEPLPIIAKTNFDGESVPMLFDTGASAHFIDPRWQSHLHNPRGERPGLTADREMKVKVWEAPAMALGQWALPPASIVPFDFAAVRRSGVNVQGILGRPILKDAALEVNFDEGKLRIIRDYTPPTATSLLKPGEKATGVKYVPVDWNAAGDPTIRIDIDGVAARALIDTGAIACFQLRKEIFNQLVANGTIQPAPESEDVYSATAAGVIKNRTGTFTRGTVLGIDLKGTPVEACETVDIIGLPFLLHFNFVYDLPGRRFVFSKRHAEPPISISKIIGGGFTYPPGECRVDSIDPGPAQDAGLKTDDIVLKLGPLQADELNWHSIYDLLETSAGQIIDLEYKRGDGKEVYRAQLKLREKEFQYPPDP